MPFNVTARAVGNGAIDYTLVGNVVTFSVIPEPNHHLDRFVIIGDTSYLDDLIAENGNLILTEADGEISVQLADSRETSEIPLVITMVRDIDVTAYFEENEKFHIAVSTNVPNGSVYVSNNDDYVGYESTLWARPIPGYVFEEWDDGNIDNPRTITVTSNVTLLAKYTKAAESNGIYQYRCFVKDQLNMTQPPKAFMVIETFDIKRDLITNAKSTITVLDIAENVNNGDVLVIVNPKGEFIYHGVITAIEDKKISCSQMQSFYKGNWIYNVHPSASLEAEIAYILSQYAQGKMFGSTYTDSLVAQRLGGITIDYVGSTNVSLPTDNDDQGNPKYTTKDMEKWIYTLYEDYGIIFDFEINFSGTNYVHIKVPTYDPIKVGNNMYAIQNMSPIETIEETNRLIIYGQDHSYRTTYVATKNGIVEEPTSTVNRFNITNTKIVSSNDDLADLVANNLPSQMYNHKLTFDLVIKNFIYQFGEFKLGMPLDVWHGSDYYNSILTGYQMKKEANQNVTMVSFTCGKIRQALTSKLLMGVVND